MILSEADIAGRWSEDVILDLWSSYHEDEDDHIDFWLTPEGQDLCCDCASDYEAVHGEGVCEDVWTTNPRIGCDVCETVIAFD